MKQAKLNQKGVAHMLILLIAIILVAILGAGYYVYRSNQTDNEPVATSTPTPTPEESDEPTASVQPISSTTPNPAAKNELDTLRTACASLVSGDAANTIGSIKYFENANGKYGTCGINHSTGAGAMAIMVLVNAQWKNVFTGNGIMDSSICDQYKIPYAIYDDCKY